jgi:radical SAM protein with 4Fe4S-binding SPASM domain
MCYTKTCPKGTMTDGLFTKVVNECAVNNVKTIVPFFRGEPFCDPKFVKRMQYIIAKMPDTRIEMATNGTLITQKDIENLCGFGVDFISISIDTGDRNLTQEQKERADQAVEMISKSKTEKMFLQVSTVEVGQGTEALNEFFHKWKDKVNRVRVFEQHTIAGKYGKTKREKEGRTYCKKLDSDMVIYFDGTVSLCCYDWDRKPNEIGNANDSMLKEIWNGAKYNSIRRQHKELKITDRVCRNCDMWR